MYNTGYFSSADNSQNNTSGVYSYPVNQQYGYQNQAPIKEEPQKRKKGSGKLVFACIILSLVCGIAGAFGGMYAYDMLFSTSNGQANTTGSTTVIYESADTKVPTTVTEAGAVAAVAKTALPSVVEISTEAVANNSFYGQYVTEGAGSGVVISKDGYIVTNNHVVNGASNITVRLSNGDEHKATLIGTDSQTDVAVIKIDVDGLTPAIYGNSDNLIIGELTVAIGNPLGKLGGTVTDGIISALDREITVEGENMVLLQTNAAVSPGNSGGGLFNGKGELIGIVNAKSSGENIEGLGFAIPINTAKPIINDLIEKGYVTGRPSIGVSVIEITTDYQKYMYKVNEYGVYIQSSINKDFKTGDRIIAIDGNTVSTFAEIKAIIKNHNVGDKLTVTVSRQNKIIDVKVTLVDSSQNTTANK
ncbi:MAG: trypsin-like serine protease [Ruminococcaceae bacterium]|nr:trypsin-like serine protease [Oscillospiraceae bacterium]